MSCHIRGVAVDNRVKAHPKDNLLGTALDAGANQLKAPKKQFWGGYEGILHVPDGTIWKVATEAKKNTDPATRDIDASPLATAPG